MNSCHLQTCVRHKAIQSKLVKKNQNPVHMVRECPTMQVPSAISDVNLLVKSIKKIKLNIEIENGKSSYLTCLITKCLNIA